MNFKKFLLPVFCIITLISGSGCFSVRKSAYFHNMRDSSLAIVNKNFEPTIKPGDILSVGVASLDPLSSALFNSVGVGTGLLVDAQGLIEIPKLGKVLAMGKTKAQLSGALQDSLLQYLKDPVVTIRFMNYRITVLGEVLHPMTFIVPNERVSILEALGQAGDMTASANRKNVLLIHENNGRREFHRINLRNSSLFKSPYYYLQSNDVLYVEPTVLKAYSNSAIPVLIPLLVSSATLLILSLTYIRTY